MSSAVVCVYLLQISPALTTCTLHWNSSRHVRVLHATECFPASNHFSDTILIYECVRRFSCSSKEKCEMSPLSECTMKIFSALTLCSAWTMHHQVVYGWGFALHSLRVQNLMIFWWGQAAIRRLWKNTLPENRNSHEILLRTLCHMETW